MQSKIIDLHTQKNLLRFLPYKRKSYTGFLNLANNELVHPIIISLWQKFKDLMSGDEVSHYPYYQFLINQLADFFNLDPSQVLVSAGSDDAIKMITFLMIAQQKKLIIQIPNYHSYTYYAQLINANIQEIFHHPDNVDLFIKALMERMKNSNPSLVVLTNPNGISGISFNLNQIREVLELGKAKYHIVVLDEAFVDFSHMEHISLLSEFDNLIIIHSFSKNFGLAGLRIAATFSSPQIINYLWRWNGPNPISSLSLLFLQYCLQNKDKIQQAQSDIKRSREWFIKELIRHKPRWKVYPSHGNFVLVDTQNKSNSETVCQLLKEKKIIVRNLSSLPGYESCFRTTLAPIEVLKTVMRVLEEKE